MNGVPRLAGTCPLIDGLQAWLPGGAAKLMLMNPRVAHLIDQALALAPGERSAVVVALLDSLDGEDEVAIAKAWAGEIRRRKNDLRSGAAQATPWAEARARLSALFVAAGANV